MADAGERLDSWKEIAEYLGRDRTTVMRWERSAGLPVRRVTGTPGKSVFAYRADIDQWLLRQPPPPADVEPPGRPWKTVLAASAAALILILLAGLVVSQASGSKAVASVALSGHEIVATDTGGRERWRLRLPHIDGHVVPARFLVTDVQGGADPEVLAAIHYIRGGRQDAGVLMLIDGSGDIIWERSLDDRYRFGDVDYGPAWFPSDIAVYGAPGARRIAVAYHHQTWWPGVVVTYDASGNAIARFVNAGWITSVNVSADSRHLLAAGINNSLGGAALAVLDAARPEGVSPADGGSLPPCSTCPQGSPVSYFLAPWTELARPSDTPPVTVNVTPSGTIEWRAVQRAAERGKVPEVIVTLSPALDVMSQSVNDFFAETAGTRQPVVRRWTSPTGWR